MPGLYSHTSRAAGTVVTASIYNGDHQNHIDNQTPDKTDDWSSSAAQKQLASDPFAAEVTDTLAASLAEEVQQLRFAVGSLASMINGTNPAAGFGAHNASTASTALGTAVAQWYFGVRNPGFRAVGCSIQKNTAFTHTATDTFETVSFTAGDTTQNWDQDGAGTGFHEGITNPTRITIPANLGGKYAVFAVGEFASSVTGDRRGLRVRKNGATVVVNFDGPHNTTFVATSTLPINLFGVISLVATDFLELQSVQDIAAASTVIGPGGSAGPVFGVHLLGS